MERWAPGRCRLTLSGLRRRYAIHHLASKLRVPQLTGVSVTRLYGIRDTRNDHPAKFVGIIAHASTCVLRPNRHGAILLSWSVRPSKDISDRKFDPFHRSHYAALPAQAP